MTAADIEHAAQGDVASFFHINVNCSDFERSLAFYRLIGFEVVNDFSGDATFGEVGLGPVLRLPPDCAGRAVLMKLKGDRHGPRLRLSAAGHTCYTPPARVALGGSVIDVFCAEDPDGVVIEFMQFLEPA
jgi:catechol 2,3-dioxygenase-like lactoylglutathione lyase family enzyme